MQYVPLLFFIDREIIEVQTTKFACHGKKRRGKQKLATSFFT